MKFNIFEGARRIALLIGGIAVAGTLIALATHDPYASVQYSIANPNGTFVRIEESCPSDAGQHYFLKNQCGRERVSHLMFAGNALWKGQHSPDPLQS